MQNLIFSAFLIFGFSAGAQNTPCGPGVKGAPHIRDGFLPQPAAATVDKTAFVGKNAAVCDYALVRDKVMVFGNARF